LALLILRNLMKGTSPFFYSPEHESD